MPANSARAGWRCRKRGGVAPVAERRANTLREETLRNAGTAARRHGQSRLEASVAQIARSCSRQGGARHARARGAGQPRPAFPLARSRQSSAAWRSAGRCVRRDQTNRRPTTPGGEGGGHVQRRCGGGQEGRGGRHLQTREHAMGAAPSMQRALRRTSSRAAAPIAPAQTSAKAAASGNRPGATQGRRSNASGRHKSRPAWARSVREHVSMGIQVVWARCPLVDRQPMK